MHAQALNTVGVCVGSGSPNGTGRNITNQTQLIECSVYKDTTNRQVWVYDPALSAPNRWVLIFDVGPYQTTGAANGMSASGNNIRLHSASNTAPGAVDLTDEQFLGNNTKIFSESSAFDISVPLKIRNPLSETDDSGVKMQFLAGASNTVVSEISTTVGGGSVSGGTYTEIRNRQADNVVRTGIQLIPNNTTRIVGFQGGSNQLVASAYNAASGVGNRFANYEFQEAGGVLTLPVSSVDEGTIVYLNSTYLTGANGSVNTPAAYAEFAYDTDQDAGTAGTQFYATSLSVAPMQSLTLKAMTIEGQTRWKVISSSVSGTQTISRDVNTNAVSLTPGGGSVNIDDVFVTETVTVTAGATSFTTSQPLPIDNSKIFVYRNGLLHEVGASGCTTCNVVRSGNTFTVDTNSPFVAGEIIKVKRPKQ